jgi:hypothetical protein
MLDRAWQRSERWLRVSAVRTRFVIVVLQMSRWTCGGSDRMPVHGISDPPASGDATPERRRAWRRTKNYRTSGSTSLMWSNFILYKCSILARARSSIRRSAPKSRSWTMSINRAATRTASAPGEVTLAHRRVRESLGHACGPHHMCRYVSRELGSSPALCARVRDACSAQSMRQLYRTSIEWMPAVLCCRSAHRLAPGARTIAHPSNGADPGRAHAARPHPVTTACS